jgi:UDP-N-acetylmuramyl tripeptide synthase
VSRPVRRKNEQIDTFSAVSATIPAGADGRLAAIELDALREAIRPARTVNAAPADIADLAYDARRAAPGTLFFCVPGFKADGH